MKKVISFYLEKEVIDAIKELPKYDRSRRVNEVLKAVLVEGKKISEGDSINSAEIKSIIQEALSEVEIAKPAENADENANARAMDALADIISSRD